MNTNRLAERRRISSCFQLFCIFSPFAQMDMYYVFALVRKQWRPTNHGKKETSLLHRRNHEREGFELSTLKTRGMYADYSTVDRGVN